MTRSASTKGFHSISITEHISQFRKPRSEIKFGSVLSNGRMFDNFGEYLCEFEKLKKSGDINLSRVKKGLEVDFSPDFEKQISCYVNQRKWDILLVLVHELSDGEDIENRKLSGDPNSSRERWNEYIDLEKRALESEFIPFDVLTHPIRLARGTPSVPDNFDEMLVALAAVAKENEKALELNGNDISRDFPFVERLAKACGELMCRISFGSDAHHPGEVGRGLGKAKDLVERYNLSVISEG
jgi:HisJ family histidinol phosphate phosphatase